MLACAQACGIVLAEAGVVPLPVAVALGASCLALAWAWRDARARLALALCTAAAAGAAGHAARCAAPVWPAARVREAVVEGRVAAVGCGAAGWWVDLEQVRAVDAPPVPRRVRVRGDPVPAGVADFGALLPGERVRARLRLRGPGGLRNPGSPDREGFWRRAGIGAVARLAHPALFVRLPSEGSLLLGVHALRARLGARLSAAGPGGSLLAALALGQRAGLSAEARECFAALGLAHLLAVSGLHLGLVAAAVYAGLRRGLARLPGLAARWDPRAGALAGAAGVALGYALLAGWGIPVRRALVLLVALAAGFASRRPHAPGAPLALAALWILAREPGALFAPGAQLSFAASAALLLARRRPGGGSAVGRSLRTSATALAVTAPLAAWHWGGRAPLALLANALAVPWTAVALLPAALLSALAAALGSGPVAGGVIAIAERLAAASLAAAGFAAARLPGVASGPPPAPAWLLLAALLGASALALRGTAARVLVAAGVGGLLAWAPVAVVSPLPPRVVVLDVGQGDAVLVQGREAALLVDAGVALPGGPDLGRQVVVPALRALGVARLDLLVASHADLDHRGGLRAVLEALPVGELWLPPDPGAFAGLRAAARARGVPVRRRDAASPGWARGDLAVSVLWPAAAGGPADRNDRSLVLRVRVAGRHVLLPGDLEQPGEAALVARGVPLAAEILKLPHHGSRSSSSAAFLAAVSPRVAVASAPCPGRWRMPHPDVRARLRAVGASLWWTGRDGAVAVGAGPVLHAAGTGAARRCPAPRPDTPPRRHPPVGASQRAPFVRPPGIRGTRDFRAGVGGSRGLLPSRRMGHPGQFETLFGDPP